MNQIEDQTDLDVLRSINSEIKVDPAAVEGVWTRLQLAEPAQLPRRPWRRLIPAAVAAIAVGAAAGLIVPRFIYPTAPQTPEPASVSTAQFVTEAARATLLNATKPSASQWVRLTLIAESISYTNVIHGKITNRQQPWTRTQVVDTVYVPGNPKLDWIRVQDTYNEPLSADARKVYSTAASRHFRSKPERAANGAFKGPVETTCWKVPGIYLAGLPSDPTKLLAKAKADLPSQVSEDSAAQLSWFADRLGNTWIADPELRAAMFEAIGQINGIQLTEDVPANGQTGTALRATSTVEPGAGVEVVFDPTDYRVISLSYFSKTEKTLTTYQTRIVNSAP